MNGWVDGQPMVDKYFCLFQAENGITQVTGQHEPTIEKVVRDAKKKDKGWDGRQIALGEDRKTRPDGDDCIVIHYDKILSLRNTLAEAQQKIISFSI